MVQGVPLVWLHLNQEGGLPSTIMSMVLNSYVTTLVVTFFNVVVMRGVTFHGEGGEDSPLKDSTYDFVTQPAGEEEEEERLQGSKIVWGVEEIACHHTNLIHAKQDDAGGRDAYEEFQFVHLVSYQYD